MSFFRETEALLGQGRWWVAGPLASSHTAQPTPQLPTHLLVTHPAAGGPHPEAHLQPGVQGPLGGTLGILLGGRAVGNIHNHPGGGVDAEEGAARGGRAVRGTDREDSEAQGGWPSPALPSCLPFPKECPHQRAASLTLTRGCEGRGCQEVVRNKASPLVQRAYPGTRNIAGRCAQQRHTHGCVHRATCTPEACSLQTHTGLCPNKESDRLLFLEL